ncbi:nucleotide exchange factor GrpE [Patescibacteria group bacterium]|nr:nucleotide exchange factor GrpE [Patescibacteria group bacterium]
MTNPKDQKDPQIDIAKLQNDLSAMTETAKRAMADLQNFKRRTEEERAEIQIFANLQLLQAIFPAIDNLARAFDTLPDDLKDHEFIKGIEATEKNLLTALQDLGLETIDETGIPADPYLHEVLMEGEGEKGQVTKVFEKGYAFKGKAIKAAKVEVGKG